jgi:ribosomal protein L7/L12
MDDSTESQIIIRLNRLERKVDFLLRELNLVEKEEATLPDFDPVLSAVAELVRQNHKIEAIKLYRELTGVGLKEAKEVVDRLS